MTIEWGWFPDHADEMARLTADHLATAVPAVLLGLLIALPLAVLAHRIRPLRGVILGASNILYTIPSLAFFVLLLPVTGLTRTTAIVGLTAYTLVVLVRNTVEGWTRSRSRSVRRRRRWGPGRCAPCSPSSCRSPSR